MQLFLCIVYLHVHSVLGVGVIAPSGITLCEVACHHVKGCRSYRFDAGNLRCQLPSGNAEDALQDKSTTFIQRKVRFDECPVSECSIGERCVKNRRRSVICLQAAGGKDRNIECNKNEMSAQLLAIRRGHWKLTPLKQINIRTRKVTKHPFIVLKFVLDMQYDTSLRRLYVITTFTYGVLSYRLDRKGTSVLTNAALSLKGFLYMAIDETDNSLFLIFRSGEKMGLVKVSTVDATFQIIDPQLQMSYPNDIVVDTSRRVIYISSLTVIKCMPYEGGALLTVLEVSYVTAMMFDSTNSELLYVDQKSVKRWTVSSNSSSLVINLSVRPRNFQLYQQKCYILEGHRCLVGDITTGHVSLRQLKTEQESFAGRLVTSFLPC